MMSRTILTYKLILNIYIKEHKVGIQELKYVLSCALIFCIFWVWLGFPAIIALTFICLLYLLGLFIKEYIDEPKIRTGTVISDKMNKTRVVQVKWVTKHAKYQKVVRFASKYKAHDENNQTKEGDVVRIMETRPLSKDKRWVITGVVKNN